MNAAGIFGLLVTLFQQKWFQDFLASLLNKQALTQGGATLSLEQFKSELAAFEQTQP